MSTVNKILQVNLCTLKFAGHYCKETEASQNKLAQWYQIIKLIQFIQLVLGHFKVAAQAERHIGED